MGLPLLILPDDSAESRAKSARHRAIPQRRTWLGILLILAVVLGGRGLRKHLLLGPQGVWREHLWLDELVLTPAASAADQPPARPRLTTPLPINTCSRDSLILLPGVGPVLADRIEVVREGGMVFRCAEDLKVVKGIGPVLAGKLAPVVDFTVRTTAGAVSDTTGYVREDQDNSR